MKLVIQIVLFAILASCGSVRKTTIDRITKTDSTVLNVASHRRDSVSYLKTVLVRDTVINIPGRTIKDTLAALELQPAFTKSGTAVTRNYTAETKGAHAFLNVLPDGSVEYGCNADSLNVIVRSLVQENTQLLSKVDSIQQVTAITNKNNITEQHSSVTKTRSFIAAAWPYLLAIVVIVLAAWFIKRYLKWPL